MAEQSYGAAPKEMSKREEELVFDVLQDFQEKLQWRNVTAAQWEEVAELILPTYRNTFQFGNYNYPGQKKTDRQVDATGMMALSRFAAICDSLLTPSNSYWHGLKAIDPYVMKDRACRLWFEKATNLLFEYRYMTEANFIAQNQAKYQSIGAFGNSGLFIDELDVAAFGRKGVRYKSVPLGELFFRENHQGMVTDVTRWFRLTARQCKQKWPDTFPSHLQPALERNSDMLYDFLHRVWPNNEYEAGRLDNKGKRFKSVYVCMQSKTLMQEGAYRTFPYEIQRYDQAPGEVYARGAGMMVLPALKTLNAEKRTFLKQGHRAGDPVLLTYDDGLLSFDMTPGAMNPGGMNSDGKPLVGILPTGQIQITEDMMKEERALINDAFLVTLFQILTETPQMSATEVIERTNEKGILLAPTVGRLRPDAMVYRELDILMSLRLLPPMPPRLVEAGGLSKTGIVFTSPLAKAMKAQEAAGFFRSLEGAKEAVAITGDASILDRFDFDTAFSATEIPDIQSVPESWMADDKKLAAKRKARADKEQRQEMIQAAPAAAAMMKARAAGGGGNAAPAQAPAQPGPPLTSVS